MHCNSSQIGMKQKQSSLFFCFFAWMHTFSLCVSKIYVRCVVCCKALMLQQLSKCGSCFLFGAYSIIHLGLTYVTYNVICCSCSCSTLKCHSRAWNFCTFGESCLDSFGAKFNQIYAFHFIQLLLQFEFVGLISLSSIMKEAKLVALVCNDAFTLPISHLIFHFLIFDLLHLVLYFNPTF